MRRSDDGTDDGTSSRSSSSSSKITSLTMLQGRIREDDERPELLKDLTINAYRAQVARGK